MGLGELEKRRGVPSGTTQLLPRGGKFGEREGEDGGDTSPNHQGMEGAPQSTREERELLNWINSLQTTLTGYG